MICSAEPEPDLGQVPVALVDVQPVPDDEVGRDVEAGQASWLPLERAWVADRLHEAAHALPVVLPDDEERGGFS